MMLTLSIQNQGWMTKLGNWWAELWGTNQTPMNKQIEYAAAILSEAKQVEMPVKHQFAPGVYLREIFMPAGTFVIGKEHKTEHFNVVLSGRARVMIDGAVTEVKAPCIFVSHAGTMKVLNILEDMRWATIHPTKETRIEKLEKKLVKDHNLDGVMGKQIKEDMQCHLQ